MKKYFTLSLLLSVVICIYSFKTRTNKISNSGPSIYSSSLTTDSLGCGTEERDSLEFENLPYFNNNDYLEDLLDSLEYPGIEDLLGKNYADYPTRYWIPIKFWVIRNSAGTGGATELQIRKLMNDINEIYRESNTLIQFYQQCHIGYIDNDSYVNLNWLQAGAVSRDNVQSGVVNVFLGDGLPSSVSGVRMPDVPLLSKKSVFLSGRTIRRTDDDYTFAHEVGHYLGLDHTHQYSKRVCLREPVSRTRTWPFLSSCRPFSGKRICESTGDALRDTPADPDLYENTECFYELGGIDMYGDFYDSNPPMVNNVMSYNGPGDCGYLFTRLQVAVMLNFLERDFGNLLHATLWKSSSSLFDTFEPDNSRNTVGTTQILKCVEQNRNFHMQYNPGVSFTSCDEDWTRYVATSNETIDIYTRAVPGNPTVNTSLYVYDSANNLIASNDDKASGNIYSKVTIPTTINSEYFIRVVNNSNTSGGYYALAVGTDLSAISITGDAAICNSSTYSVPNLPTGATVSWSVTGPYTISGSSTSNTVQINKTANGTGILSVVVSSCDVRTITKALVNHALSVAPGGNGYCGEATISVNSINSGNFTWTVSGDLQINGASSQTYVTTDNYIEIIGTEGNITVNANGCVSPINLGLAYSPYKRDITIVSNLPLLPNDPLSAFVTLDYSVDTYRWYMNNTLDFDNTTSNYWTNDRDKDGRVCGMNTLRLEVDLTCGSSVVVGEIQFEQLCSEWFSAYRIFPNPASSYIQVGPNEQHLSKMNTTDKSRLKEYQVTLLDNSGRAIMVVRSNGKKATLNTAQLPSGQYHIHLKADGEKEVIKRQIVIRN